MQPKWSKFTCLLTILLININAANAGRSIHVVPSIKLSATVNKNNQRGEIRWCTLPGKNNTLRFEVQKSTDGNNFSYVTSVAGDRSNNLKQYFAEDRNLLEGNNYYRLKIMYKDGTESYTSVAQMALTAPSVTVLPLVAEEKLHLWLPENTHIVAASVTDLSGKLISKQAAVTIGAGLADIDVKKLSPGFYNLIVQVSLTEKIHLKFSKK